MCAEAIPHSPVPGGKGELIPGFISSVLGDPSGDADTQSFFDGICVAIACDRAAASGQIETVEYL